MAFENELSEREIEILTLVATGASNKEIAQKLVISPNTVKVHLRNIFAKIEVASRTEATMYAIRAGLIPAPVAESTQTAEPLSTPVLPEPEGALNRLAKMPAWIWLGGVILLVAVIAGAFFGGQMIRAGQSMSSAPETRPPDVSRWQSLAVLPAARSHMAITRFADDVYLFGGEAADGVLSDTLRYDIENDAWEVAASKPTAVADVQAALLGEKVYIPGGRLPSGEPTNVLEIYDPRHDRWESGEPLPVTLSAYALAAFEGRLYLFGGWDGSRYVDTVYEFDPGSGWTERQRMSQPRGFASAVVVSGSIQVIGGTDGEQSLSLNEAFFPHRTGEGEVAWETRAPLPDRRYGASVVEMASMVFLFGGDAGQPPLQYLPFQDEWQVMEGSPEPVGIGFGMVPVNTHLHFFGGRLNGELLDHHLAYQAVYIVPLPILK